MLVYGFRQMPGSKQHYDWWFHDNQDRIKKEFKILWEGHADFRTYVSQLYRVEFGLVK